MYTTCGSLGSSTRGVSVVHRIPAGQAVFGKLHLVVTPPASWKPEQFWLGGTCYLPEAKIAKELAQRYTPASTT